MSVEAKTTSSEVITADPLACNGVPTSSGPYRLYKRRWVGVFAMVRTAFFIRLDKVESLCEVYARGCRRRRLAVVWSHIQQQCNVWFCCRG